jgi:hypothetical protein
MAETGLSQNYFRDYDPTVGRYVESDPIGLLGGINTYAYANGNPLSYKDPSGQLALFWHFLITYNANRACGGGVLGSLKLAYQTMAVDFGSQGTSPSDTNIHAMLGTTDANGQPSLQSPSDAMQAINSILNDAPLYVALHTAQDAATPAHFLQPWNGFQWDWTTAAHLWGDVFPSSATVDKAQKNSMAVLGCGCSK